MHLDTDRILSTDSKVLANALVELAKSGNTVEAAQKYFDLYKMKPLSFIIDNSEKIFAEPRLGLSFYRDKLKYFPIFTLCNELTKITNYLHDHKDKMHPMLEKDYQNLLDTVRSRIDNTKRLGIIEDVILSKHPEEKARIMAMCDVLPIAGDDERSLSHCGDENTEDDRNRAGRERIEAFDKLNKMVRTINPIISLIYLAISPNGSILRNCTRNVAKAIADGYITKTMEAAIYVNMMNESESFREAVNNIQSADARCILQGLAEANIIREFNAYTESVLAEDTTPITVTLDNFVEAAMANLQEDRANADENLAKKGQLIEDKLTIYESVMDIVMAIYESEEPSDIMEEFPIFTQIKEAAGITEKVTVEDALKIIVEATAEVESELESLTQEYTIDGRPGSVITRHNSGTRYNEDIKKGIENRPKASAPSRSGASDDDEYDDDNEIDYNQEIPQSARYRGSEGMPDDSDPNSKKPQKPKQGVADRISNAALDADAASKKFGNKVKGAGQAVVKTGKAILKIPVGLLTNIMALGKQFSKMDDDRRKEYMIQPGYRKKVFKNLRVAMMYYITAQVNILYLPIAWFARQLSKSKNTRIRNEFSAELETEIKVTEAKIEDAASRGDQQQKYQLMRIRDKLNLDLQRVKYNARNL